MFPHPAQENDIRVIDLKTAQAIVSRAHRCRLEKFHQILFSPDGYFMFLVQGEALKPDELDPLGYEASDLSHLGLPTRVCEASISCFLFSKMKSLWEKHTLARGPVTLPLKVIGFVFVHPGVFVGIIDQVCAVLHSLDTSTTS